MDRRMSGKFTSMIILFILLSYCISHYWIGHSFYFFPRFTAPLVAIMVYHGYTTRASKMIIISWYGVITCASCFYLLDILFFIWYTPAWLVDYITHEIGFCRLWICSDQACGMFGIIIRMRECNKKLYRYLMCLSVHYLTISSVFTTWLKYLPIWISGCPLKW